MTTTLGRVSQARELYEKLTSLNQASGNIYWLKAEIFHSLKRNNLFRFVFGEDRQSWASFCAEIQVPVSSADQKVENYEFFVARHGFKPKDMEGLDTSCLYYLTRYKKDAPKEDVEEKMKDLKVLSRGDFLDQLKGNECGHLRDPIQKITLHCPDCQKKIGTKRS